MSNAAAFYASQPNTTVTPAGSNLNLTASGSGATYFDEPASDLDQSNENVTLTAGAGQFIIVVVPDASFSFGSSEHITLGGSTSGEQIMWDFPNATTVSLDDSLWTGSLLAPGATLTDNNQDIAGGVYVENFTQTAEVHLSDPNLTPGEPQFGGPTPSVPEPSSLLLFNAASFVFMRRYHPANIAPIRGPSPPPSLKPASRSADRSCDVFTNRYNRHRPRFPAEYPSGLRGRIANPLFVGSNPTSAFKIASRQLNTPPRPDPSPPSHTSPAPDAPLHPAAAPTTSDTIRSFDTAASSPGSGRHIPVPLPRSARSETIESFKHHDIFESPR